jgi:hypothetical protein
MGTTAVTENHHATPTTVHTRWWERNDPEAEDRFARALNNLVRNWMANSIIHRAGWHSRMTGREAGIHTAGNMSAPGARKCFDEVTRRLGPSNTVEELLLRAAHVELFPAHVRARAGATLAKPVDATPSVRDESHTGVRTRSET